MTSEICQMGPIPGSVCHEGFSNDTSPDPRAAPALVRALDDENSGVRWVAAKGLVGLGKAGLDPLKCRTGCGLRGSPAIGSTE